MTTWWLFSSLAEKQSVICAASEIGILAFHVLVEQPTRLLLPKLRTPLQVHAGLQVHNCYQSVVGSL